MKLYSINAGFFKLDGGAMFGVVPKSMWSKVNNPDANNMCTWAMRCLLVEQDNSLVLIDNGMGNKQDEKFYSHFYPHGDESVEKNLKKFGFTTDDITDVFLTHLHFDHCGGSIKRNANGFEPVFKNATYWSNQSHWNWAISPNERESASFLEENILPIKESGKLKFIDEIDGIEWKQNIKIRFVYGHTEALMLPQINFNGKPILFCADLMPSVPHISMPWVMAYDMRPLETLKEKRRLLNEIYENNGTLFFEHDPVNECCSLQQTPKGIRPNDIYMLSDLTV